MALTAAQCRAARALLDWSRGRLAAAAGVPESAIAEFEAGRRAPDASALADLEHALAEAGVATIAENGGGAGVRLTKPGLAPQPGPSAALEAVLAAFATHQLPKAMEQDGVDRLAFVRAGPQATLMEGTRTIGLVTLRDDGAVFKPPLSAAQIGAGRDLTQADIWNWVIAAWRHSRGLGEA